MIDNTSQKNSITDLIDSLSQVKLDGVFRKSSFSGAGGCVSVAKFADGSVKVQDTKDSQREATLTYTKQEWLAFLEGVKHGEFEVEG